MKTKKQNVYEQLETPLSKAVLLHMLTIKRPYGGSGVTKFRDTFLRNIDGADSVLYDEEGNTIVSVGFKMDIDDLGDIMVVQGTVPTTMFSAHVDTVHRDDGRQIVSSEFIDGREIISLQSAADTHCLGADDAAGCWTLLNLIKERIPAVYVFHNGEEAGGIGSRYLSLNYPEFFEQFSRCIAIDRRDTTDIITHQMGGKCCSDLFASTLADAIGMHHKPDDSGVYTDSAEYTHLIPECTNISSGYYREHTVRETLDLTYLQDLVNALLNVDFESLPTQRDVLDDGWADMYAPFDDDYEHYYTPKQPAVDHIDRGYTYYEDLVFQDPYHAATLLFQAYNKQ